MHGAHGSILRKKLLGLIAIMAGCWACIETARAANTDVYTDWALPADPGWLWANYLDYVNRSSVNTGSESALIEYQTKTGLTGTTRDSFQFWLGGSVGYQETLGAPHSGAVGVAAPIAGVEWYYNVFQNGKPGDPGYRNFTISPWVQVNAPNGNTNAGGFGAGSDQWSYTGTLLATYRAGRFTTTLQPITLSYADTNQNTSPVTNTAGLTSFTKGRLGWTGSFGVFNIGYDVTPTLTLALYQSWNAYSLGGIRNVPRQAEGTIGPMVSYSGLSDSLGLTIAGTVQADYYHTSNLPEGVFVSLYVVKHF